MRDTNWNVHDVQEYPESPQPSLTCLPQIQKAINQCHIMASHPGKFVSSALSQILYRSQPLDSVTLSAKEKGGEMSNCLKYLGLRAGIPESVEREAFVFFHYLDRNCSIIFMIHLPHPNAKILP